MTRRRIIKFEMRDTPEIIGRRFCFTQSPPVWEAGGTFRSLLMAGGGVIRRDMRKRHPSGRYSCHFMFGCNPALHRTFEGES